jgi:branched-chain amino acid transport system permease protein
MAVQTAEPAATNLLARIRTGRTGARRRRRLEAIVAGVGLVLIYVGWVGDDPYRQGVLILGIAYTLLGLGIYIPLVMGGRLSVCYNAYFAAGAYSVGLIATKTDWPLLVSIPVGLVVSAVIAAFVAFVCRGLGGYHLAVATIAVAEMADRVLIDWAGFTGGSIGIGGIPQLTLFGITFDVARLAIVGLVAVWLLTVMVNRLRDSVWGFAVRLQRDAPVAVEAAGASVESLRTASVCIGAAIASIGGMLLALANNFIIPESFAFIIIFTVIFIPILGGSSTAWGCLLGALVVTWLNNFKVLGELPGGLVFGAGTLVILVVAPAGCLGLLYAAWPRLRRLVRGRSAGAS